MDRAVGRTREAVTSLALAALAAVATTAAAQPQAPPRYSIVELAGVPTRINDSGQVSGWVNVGGAAHAAIFSGGAWRDLGALPGDQLSAFYDVNNAGAAVGFSFASLQPPIPPDTFADNRWQAAWAPAGATAIQALTLIAPDSFAYAINDAGVIVGCLNRYDDVFPDPHRAYLFANGTLTDLHALMSGAGSQGFDFTCARDVNAQGAVVGEVQLQNQPSRGFLYRSGAVTTLVQGAAYLTNARAINGSGLIVGEGRLAGFGADQAVLFDSANGSIRGLGVEATGAFSSKPNDINSRGDVVGTMFLNVGERAFLAAGGSVYDLNDLIPAGGDWVLQEAFSINARGQIVGRGFLNSDPTVTRYFLLDASAPLPSIGSLIQQVKALHRDGFLSRGNATAMIAELKLAERRLHSRCGRLSVLALEIFVRHVDVLIRTGRLSPGKGQPLIDQARLIIDSILAR